MNLSLDQYYDLLDEEYLHFRPKPYTRHVWADMGHGEGGVTYNHHEMRIKYTAYYLNGHMENALNADTTRVIVDKIAFNFARIYNKLTKLHPEYETFKLSAYINNIEPFVYDRLPLLNVDYSLGQNGQTYKYAQSCNRLYCTANDLDVGDVANGVKITTSSHEMACYPHHLQGYFYYELTDGLKYRLFMQYRERVAWWNDSRRRWQWYGFTNNRWNKTVNIRKLEQIRTLD